MPKILKNIANQITTFWSKFDKKKKIVFIILMSLVLIISIILVSLISRTEYAVLYTGLDASEAGEIYMNLVDKKYDVKTKDDGTILVPKKYENNIRMELAAEGYPKSGLNYDIFKNSTGFGTTEYEKKMYMRFQLQDRLQQTIKTLDNVQDAIVTLNIPDNSSIVLSGDKKPATASVTLKTDHNTQLNPSQVRAIAELVSKSVEGLTTDNISIIDSRGMVYDIASPDEINNTGTQLELEKQVGDRLKDDILKMLEPVFGYGKVVAGVSVRLDFDKKTTETIKFEPVLDDSGIAVSLTELKEITRSSGSGAPAGQDPNGGAPQYPSVEDEIVTYEKISKTVNYEINQTKELIEKAQGTIKDLTVSVVINSEERNEEIISQVRDIISGAVGIDSELVSVQSMPFNGSKELDDMFESLKASSIGLSGNRQLET